MGERKGASTGPGTYGSREQAVPRSALGADQCRLRRGASNAGTPNRRRSMPRAARPRQMRTSGMPARISVRMSLRHGPNFCSPSSVRRLMRYSRLSLRAVGRVARSRAAKPRKHHAARLDRHRLRARLYRPPVRDRELRRPDAAVRPRRPLATLHLSAFARDLLHLLDVLRLGRASPRATASTF